MKAELLREHSDHDACCEFVALARSSVQSNPGAKNFHGTVVGGDDVGLGGGLVGGPGWVGQDSDDAVVSAAALPVF